MVRRTRQEYDRHANMPRDQNSNANEPCPQWAFSAGTNQLSSSGFAYDAAGDLTTDVSGAATRTYAWDAEGRLTQVTDNGGNTTTSYVYNALGQEVELKTVGSWQLEQVFDPQGERVGYYSAGSSQWLLAYVPWWGRELAKYASTTSFNFFHPNALGSAGISTDQTGTVDDDMAFYPWGQVWLNSGSNTYDTHFAGIHAALQGSNLIDFTMDQASYRFYAPNPGRWHSPDPLASDITNPQSLNSYAYVMNSPTTFVDPLGLVVAIPPGCRSLGIGPDGEPIIDCSGLWGGPTTIFGFQQPPGQGPGGNNGGGAGGGPAILPLPSPPPIFWSLAPQVCEGEAEFSAVGPNQATGSGALADFGVFAHQTGGTAVNPAVFGLTLPGTAQGNTAVQQQLAAMSPLISIYPAGLNLYGGPQPPYSISDIGDRNIRNSATPRFDLYGFPSLGSALQFGVQTVPTSILVWGGLPCLTGFTGGLL